MAMTNRTMIRATALGLLLIGCANKGAGEPKGNSETPAQTDQPAPGNPDVTARPPMTSAECEAKGGSVVGDIGDGAIHRADYACEGGQPPIGSIKPAEGEPIAIEGSVCCLAVK